MGTKTRALSADELTRYMRVITNPPEKTLVYAAACAVIMGSGARVGEVLMMRIQDLFDSAGTPKIEVTRTLEKKGGKNFLTPAFERRLQTVFLAMGLRYDPAEITRNVAATNARKRPKRLTVPFPWQQLGAPVIQWRAYVKKFYLRSDDALLFSIRYDGTPIHRRTLLRANRHFLVQAEINPRGVGLHGERKTFLRMIYRELISSGMREMEAVQQVQKLAGHARIETTILYLFDDVAEIQARAIQAAFARHAQNR